MAYEPSNEAVKAAIFAYDKSFRSYSTNDAYRDMRAALIAAHEAEPFDADAVFAELKAIKSYALEQAPVIEKIERELLRIRAEIGPAKEYASEYGLRSDVMASAVHIKIDMIDGYARAALEAVEAHRAKKG